MIGAVWKKLRSFVGGTVAKLYRRFCRRQEAKALETRQLIQSLVHGGPWTPDPHHPSSMACRVDECLDCGLRDCPRREPLHYHHDGCPACD